jgi:hypothetical protein
MDIPACGYCCGGALPPPTLVLLLEGTGFLVAGYIGHPHASSYGLFASNSAVKSFLALGPFDGGFGGLQPRP